MSLVPTTSETQQTLAPSLLEQSSMNVPSLLKLDCSDAKFTPDKLLAFGQRSQEEKEIQAKFLAAMLRSSPTVFFNESTRKTVPVQI